MLKECRKALRIKTEAYDSELCSLMKAAAQDLQIAGVIIPGIVAFTVSEDNGEEVVTDNSRMKDELVKRAIFTYVRAHFGSPDDYERLKESYNTQKVQLMHADRYTSYDGGDCE